MQDETRWDVMANPGLLQNARRVHATATADEASRRRSANLLVRITPTPAATRRSSRRSTRRTRSWATRRSASSTTSMERRMKTAFRTDGAAQAPVRTRSQVPRSWADILESIRSGEGAFGNNWDITIFAAASANRTSAAHAAAPARSRYERDDEGHLRRGVHRLPRSA